MFMFRGFDRSTQLTKRNTGTATSIKLLTLFIRAEIYHNAYGGGEKNIQRLRPIYFSVTAVMYLIVVTLLGLDWILNEDTHNSTTNIPDAATLVEKILFCFDGGLYITTAIGFVVYGGRYIQHIIYSTIRMKFNCIFVRRNIRNRVRCPFTYLDLTNFQCRFYAKFLNGGPLLTKMRDTVLPKVKILTLLCTLCFVARAVITM